LIRIDASFDARIDTDDPHLGRVDVEVHMGPEDAVFADGTNGHSSSSDGCSAIHMVGKAPQRGRGFVTKQEEAWLDRALQLLALKNALIRNPSLLLCVAHQASG
jgi:hypothetical protein